MQKSEFQPKSSTQEDLWDLTSLQAQNISSEETDKSDNHIGRYISASRTDGLVFSSISSITSKRIRLCSLFLNIDSKGRHPFSNGRFGEFGLWFFLLFGLFRNFPSWCFTIELRLSVHLLCSVKSLLFKTRQKITSCRTIRFHAVTA